MTSTGSLQADGDRFLLTFERTLPHPPARVWAGLTEAGDLAAWFPAAIEGGWAPGAELRFVFPDGAPDVGQSDDDMRGSVIEADPPRLLVFSWGLEVLRFELTPVGGGDATVLRFVDSFADGGKAARDSAGWDVCLDQLAHRLDGTEPGWDPGERWAERYRENVRRYGPEHATADIPGLSAEGEAALRAG